MKRIVLCFFLVFLSRLQAQCVIGVNPASCASANGMVEIMNPTDYDAYQWYYKPTASQADFQPIPGAISESLPFTWANYNHTSVKLSVTWFMGNQNISYFSNTLDLDSANCSLSANDAVRISVNVFPNPAHDRLIVQNPETIDEISLFDALGRRVFYEEARANTVAIDISNLGKGIYFISVRCGKSTFRKQILKS